MWGPLISAVEALGSGLLSMLSVQEVVFEEVHQFAHGVHQLASFSQRGCAGGKIDRFRHEFGIALGERQMLIMLSEGSEKA